MRHCIALAALAIFAVAAAPAHAVTFGGEVYGAYNTYAMDDWNDLIKEANQSGASIDEINGGIAGGIGLKVWANPNVMFAVAWEPLFASTEGNGATLNLDGNAFVGTVAYMVPVGEVAKYGVGAGGGYYSLSGEIKDSGSPSIDLKGNVFGFHVLGLAEWTVSPGFGVTAGAGYRAAKIDETEADGVVTDPVFETDYSGFTGRVGVVFYLPTSN